MLYLVATPIGNLGDITFRAVETLKEVDYILCEDTRYSSRLLDHYDIIKQRKSLHKFNEVSRLDEVVADLKSGKNIALISDAGTVAISDPGELLVRRCVAEQIEVTSIPGPCAAISALSCSGLETSLFQFYGFLPRKEGALRRSLLEIAEYKGTTLCYESANRICKVLEHIASLMPHRQLVIGKEMTKIHEQFFRGTASEILGQLNSSNCKGEIVLSIGGNQKPLASDWEHLSPEEHVASIENAYHISRRDAIKMAATLRGVSKREVYRDVL